MAQNRSSKLPKLRKQACLWCSADKSEAEAGETQGVVDRSTSVQQLLCMLAATVKHRLWLW